MRPIPVPDELLFPGAKKVVWGPPAGHEVDGDIRAAESMQYRSENLGVPVNAFVIQLEEGDLEKIERAGGRFFVSFMGGSVIPFDVNTFEWDD